MKVKIKMLPFITIAKSYKGNSVIVEVREKGTKNIITHTDVMLVWGDNRQKEVVKAILN
jgi:hypothetical protein